MKPSEREALRQELLELHFDCHPDPEELRARLAREPELRALFDEVAATPEDRVLVLTGAGEAFCTGADLDQLGTIVCRGGQ